MSERRQGRLKVAAISPFGLRLQPELKRRLDEVAKASARSLNAEIVSRLEFTFAVDVAVQESGWDVTHAMGSPEWIAAMLKRTAVGNNERRGTVEQRLAELETRMAELEARMD